MTKEEAIKELGAAQAFFERSTDCLTEENSAFSPKEDLYSVANHVAHVALTMDWFMEGAFRPEGFDMDFEQHIKDARACTSLTEARELFSKSMASAIETIQMKSEEELQLPLADGPIMGGQPRMTVVPAIVEHTAHHRGSLAVYSRLLGCEPNMPYGDM